MGESSIGAGVRRVEALVGSDAYRFLAREHHLVAQLTEALKVRPEELPERIESILGRLKDVERELDKLRAGQVLESAAPLAAAAKDVGGALLVAAQVPDGTTPDDLRALTFDVRNRLGTERPVVVALLTVPSDKPIAVVAVNDAARDAGIKAGALVRAAAQALGGGGGGKDDVAQGGGTDPTAIAAALTAVEAAVAAAAAGG